MNSSAGAATQIFSPQFDRRFLNLPPDVQARIKIGLMTWDKNFKIFHIIGCKALTLSESGLVTFVLFTSSIWKKMNCC